VTAALRTALATAMLVAATAVASAQDAGPAFRRTQLMASVGILTSGGFAIGDATAELRRNGIATPAPFTLFRAESDIERAIGVDARVAVALSRLLAIEVGASYGEPQLGITISQDAEAGPMSFVAQKTTQYTVDVSGIFQIPGFGLGRRLRAYAIGGGGYLRQLHEGRLAVETGHTIHAGGGVRLWLSGGTATGRAVGARAEARMIRRTGGIEFDGAPHTYPALSVLGFVAF
jgi:hypothetical protein